MQCGIKRYGMMTYNNDMLQEELPALRSPSFDNGDGIKKLMAGMPDDQALREWKLQTLKDI